MRESDKEQLFVVLFSSASLPEELCQVLTSSTEHVPPPANSEPGNAASSDSSDSPKGNVHRRLRQQRDLGV